VSKKLFAFTINTLEEAESIIKGSKIYKIKPILYFKKYFILGFGVEFILTFREILISKFGKSNFKLFVDCGANQSLAIKMANKKINYLKLKNNSIILTKINSIAHKNRVLLNPTFNIVDCRNRKNISLKLKKLYFKERK
tara:strand:- start:489 stop:905 length:417 start_codon:yes stop_codon:yes gene_type:complete